MRLIILLVFCVVWVNSSQAQSLTGTRGLMKVPTARMYPDNTLSIGAAFVPPGIFKSQGYTFGIPNRGNAGLNTFVTVNFLPFVEVMFRYSHEYNMKVQPTNEYFPDRMLTLRVKLNDESKNIPSFVLGLQDVSGALDLSCEACTYYSSLYLVSTKEFKLSNGYRIDASLGYSNDFFGVKALDFKGFFGGVEVFTPYTENMSLLWEYDSQLMNIGINGYFLKRFHVTLGLLDMSKYTWILAYRYQI